MFEQTGFSCQMCMNYMTRFIDLKTVDMFFDDKLKTLKQIWELRAFCQSSDHFSSLKTNSD